MKMKKIATGRGRREDRQRQAQERNAKYRALSVAERIKLVEYRKSYLGGNATRELARLEAAQEKANG